MTKLGLEFEEFEDLAELTDDKQVETLKKRLMESKSKEVLAYNDALIIHYIYGRRKKLGERSVTNQYGYRTWWLTHEASVRKYTKDLVAKKGCQYIMRPEFLLNFISLAPSAAEVRKSYQNVFPTLLGIRLSDRIKETVFLSMMKSVNEAQQHDDARVHAKVREMTNLLMADMVKKYDKEFSDQNFNDPF
ncbi:hypothetical protein GCM10011332_11780 [Terasakiella brassicae]|uniref:Uncharacterized protein n=1 Tax=Terasakiella brassicae TaxID=1634917 RepID=A0A917BYI5_9PROT|nr:hypothetical protein [Terasakiella brassicae]GGF59761.1 hypothetical protein GCM10011332_11780 [Terasakiella brassicae]